MENTFIGSSESRLDLITSRDDVHWNEWFSRINYKLTEWFLGVELTQRNEQS